MGGDEGLSVAPERHFPRVLRYLLRRLPPADAHDVAQEVFVRYLSRRDPEVIRDPETYLISVANNVLNGFHRTGRLVTYDSALLDRCTEDIGDTGMRPLEEEMDFNQRITDIEAACSELPYHYRRALVLKLRDECSKGEIADLLGLTVSTVRTYLRKALAHCRLVYDYYGERD